jgi:hypothetical protein
MNSDEVWLHEFGNCETATDFAGRMVRRGDYGNSRSKTGWDYDHIEPQNPNTSTKRKQSYNDITNVEIANISTNREKANKTTFMIDDTQYQVVKNTPKHINGKRIARYPYKEKRHCIVILN